MIFPICYTLVRYDNCLQTINLLLTKTLTIKDINHCFLKQMCARAVQC